MKGEGNHRKKRKKEEKKKKERKERRKEKGDERYFSIYCRQDSIMSGSS